MTDAADWEHFKRAGRPVDPLSVWCPQCGAIARHLCRTASGRPVSARASHAERGRLARPVEYVEGKVT